MAQDDGFRPAASAEAISSTADVKTNSAGRDFESESNLPVGRALGQQVEHLLLAVGDG